MTPNVSFLELILVKKNHHPFRIKTLLKFNFTTEIFV
jgi:hypothetical protein